MKTKELFCPAYSPKERGFIDHQILTLLDYVKKLEIHPREVGIDKAGHIVLFNYSYNESRERQSMSADFLGLDKDGLISLVQVGVAEFSKNGNQIKITKLGVDSKYENLNIGKMLLQGVENLAVEFKVDKIVLGSLLNKTRLKSYPLPKLNDFESKQEYYTALQNEFQNQNSYKYFDKNLYFYYCQGYRKILSPYLRKQNQELIPMVKRHLTKISLVDGIYRKEEVKPTSKRFAITKLHIRQHATSDYPQFEISEKDEGKTPITLTPNPSGVEEINHIIIENVLTLNAKPQPSKFKRFNADDYAHPDEQ